MQEIICQCSLFERENTYTMADMLLIIEKKKKEHSVNTHLKYIYMKFQHNI